MNSRQRVLAAIARQDVDRVPARFNGWGENAIKVARHLGIDTRDADWQWILYERIGIDVVNTQAMTPPDVKAPELLGATDPGKDAAGVADLDPAWARYMGNPDNFCYRYAADTIAARDGRGNRPALLLKTGMMFGALRNRRGCEQAMMELADGNEMPRRVSTRNKERPRQDELR